MQTRWRNKGKTNGSAADPTQFPSKLFAATKPKNRSLESPLKGWALGDDWKDSVPASTRLVPTMLLAPAPRTT